MDNIYQEELMFHYKNPSNTGKLEDPTVETTANNPFCGDKLNMQMHIDKGIVKDIKFEADACAVAVAASSMLTEHIKGKGVEEIKKFSKEQLLDLIGVQLTTSRVKCAVLPLEAVQKLVQAYDDK